MITSESINLGILKSPEVTTIPNIGIQTLEEYNKKQIIQIMDQIELMELYNQEKNKNLKEFNEELLEKNLSLEKCRTTDFLTGLYNRKFIEPKLEELINKFNDYSVPFSIAVIDIDFFKRINDTFGHKEGDNVLKEISKILTSMLRETDIVGRLGGEEFIVIFEGVDHKSSEKKANEIRRKIEKELFKTSKINEKITCSIGIVTINQEITNPTDIIDLADKGLYKAKRKGRNRVCNGDSIKEVSSSSMKKFLAQLLTKRKKNSIQNTV